MAVPVRFTSGSILSAEMARRMSVRATETVAVTAEVAAPCAGVEVEEGDQAFAIYFSIDGAAGEVTVVLQQSSDDDDADPYATLPNGFVLADGTTSSSYVFDLATDPAFHLLGVNPLALTEAWVRISLVTDVAFDGTEYDIVVLAGHPVAE